LYAAAFSPRLRYTFFGVFDGHNGGSTARKLAADLSEVVCLHLADVYSTQYASGLSPERGPGEPPDPQPASDKIESAIKAAFVEVDDLMVHEAARRVLGLSREEYRVLNEEKGPTESDTVPSNTPPMLRAEAMRVLREAYAGSCAILGIYNNLERSLRVALTGDSRAVLGRRVRLSTKHVSEEGQTDGKYAYEVRQLSLDQNATNPKEAERLTALHPDEPDLLKNNRVLGWGPARAFGDGIMKWSVALQKRLSKEFLGDWPRDVLKSPPYFTAEPEVTTFEGVRRGDFLVLASDGLWDSLTNEEVVGLVGKWLEERGSKEIVRLTGGEDATAEVMLPRKAYPSTTIEPSRLRNDKTQAGSGSSIQAKE
jgi:pyruvate dehydrogenase phosphatase